MRNALKSFRNSCRPPTRNFATESVRNGPSKGDKVVLAMSGGVDSSVSALLLAQKDYDLSAIYMRNWDSHDESGSETGCEWEKDWQDVQRVCNHLDIPCNLIDLSNQYWTRVFEPALKVYEDGFTPNPDIFCNREIKFGLLMRQANLGGRGWLATGHYAHIAWSEDNRPQLMRPKDRRKDQTYFLSSVSECSLRKSLFPLSNFLKADVREMARKANLPTARREESMGLCFVGERRRFNDFLSQYLPPKPGDIMDLGGNILGEHLGLWRYTIGQGAKIRGMKERMYVARKDHARNQLLVVPGADHPALYCKSLHTHDWKWIWPEFRPGNNFRATVQIRRLMSEVCCTVEQSLPGGVNITFARPEKGVAPGQVAVVWDQDWCLGCGIISDTLI